MPDVELTCKTHVQRTRHYLEAELRLDALLEITYGHAAPGRKALDLILPIIFHNAPKNWIQLIHIGLASKIVVELAECAVQALSQRNSWSASNLEQAFESIASDCELPTGKVEDVLGVLVLGQTTPLPIASVFEVVGRTECLARLFDATRAYKAMQMVG